MFIRPATTLDARSIGRLHVLGWHVGYRGIVPDEYLARQSVEESTNRWLANLAEPQPMQTIVAEDDDESLLGWVGYGVNRSNLPQNTGELFALFVDPSHWAHGIGDALLASAEQDLASSGYERAILWTLTENEHARRFYENRGWHHDGVTDIHRSGAEVVRYAKLLVPSVDQSATAE